MRITVEELCEILSNDSSSIRDASRFFSRFISPSGGDTEIPELFYGLDEAIEIGLKIGSGALDLREVRKRSEQGFQGFDAHLNREVQIYNSQFKDKEVDFTDRVSLFLAVSSSLHLVSGSVNIRLYSKVNTRSLVAILDRYVFSEDVLKIYNKEGKIDVKKTQTMYIIKDNGSCIHKHEGIWAYYPDPMRVRWMPRFYARREQNFYNNKTHMANFVEDILLQNVSDDVYVSKDPGRNFHMNEDLVSLMRFIKYYPIHNYSFNEVKLFTDVFGYKSHPKNWRFKGSQDVLNTYISTLPTKKKRRLASHCSKTIMNRVPRFGSPDVEKLITESAKAASLISLLEHPKSLEFVQTFVEAGIKINVNGKNRLAWARPAFIDEYFKTFRNVIIPRTDYEGGLRYRDITEILLLMSDTLRMQNQVGLDVLDLTHRNISLFQLHDETITIYNREMGVRRHFNPAMGENIKNFDYDKFWKERETEEIKLLHPHDFYEVGNQLSICIGSYAPSIVSDNLRAIFYLSFDKDIVCIEASRNMKGDKIFIEQAKLRFNKPVKENMEMTDAIIKWASTHDIHITTYDIKDDPESGPRPTYYLDPPAFGAPINAGDEEIPF